MRQKNLNNHSAETSVYAARSLSLISSTGEESQNTGFSQCHSEGHQLTATLEIKFQNVIQMYFPCQLKLIQMTIHISGHIAIYIIG